MSTVQPALEMHLIDAQTGMEGLSVIHIAVHLYDEEKKKRRGNKTKQPALEVGSLEPTSC